MLVGRVVCAQILGQVKIKESPLFADLCARHRAGLGPGLQCVRVQAKEFSGFGKVKGAHFRPQSYQADSARHVLRD